jgi:hypothetical protein
MQSLIILNVKENIMKYCLRVITAFIFTIQAVEAATLQTDPQVNTVGISDTFTLDVNGTDFPKTQGAGFNLSYDEEILDITKVPIEFLAMGLSTNAVEMTESKDNPWTNYNSSTQLVPIPSAIWLFGTSLLGLTGMAMRRVV